MKKYIFPVFFTAVLTATLTAVLLLGAGAYAAGGYFVDLALKRGSGGDPAAPPVVFKSAIEGSGRKIEEPRRPDYASEAWRIRSFDHLALQATHFSPMEESHRWVVLVHGYGLEQDYTWNFAEQYLRHGYQVLTPDMRASGKSEGQYLTMGALESRDVEDWVKEIRRRDPAAKVVLHGVSMGAATVMLTAARQPDGVVAAVEDSGYSDLYGLFGAELDRLLGVPMQPLLELADIICERRAGFSFAEASPINAAPSIQLPMLFVHSDVDKLVSYDMMQALYAACPAPDKEQYTAKGYPHGVAYQDKNYFPTIFTFADRYAAP